jgi:uncharacterized membrane protein (UPF0127 family)
MNEVTVTFYQKGVPFVSLTCEVAKTISQKTKGLMYRSFLPSGRGMLFLFWFSSYRLFWMKSVSIPLDIIFINKKLEVVSIHEAPANVGIFNKKFWAFGFCKYVIECNAGFCRNNRITQGTKVVYK